MGCSSEASINLPVDAKCSAICNGYLAKEQINDGEVAERQKWVLGQEFGVGDAKCEGDSESRVSIDLGYNA